MNTPICDFVRDYAARRPVRMHMPGHKGNAGIGPEALDLTEIDGADELYRSRGIIRESEINAASLFGAARTVYSAEGSSLCIRAMLYLALLTAGEKGIPGRLLAGRNAHRTLMSAAALLDLSGGPCIYKRISGCGSGTEYMAVTPAGDLYPCHQFVGEEQFHLGDVWNGVTNTAVQQEFADCNVYARGECRDCWARLYCSGGCAANAWHATGSVTGVYRYGCELFKKRMECAIMAEIDRQFGDEA